MDPFRKDSIQSEKESLNKIRGVNWVHRECKALPHLKFDQNVIEADKESSVFSRISLKGIFMFKIRIKKIHHRLSIGIVGSSNIGTGEIHKNYMLYCNIGTLWVNDENVKTTFPFECGDVVTLIGNQKEGHIQYFINEKPVCFYEYEELKNTEIEWIAFIHMNYWCAMEIMEYFSEVELMGVYLGENWFDWDDDVLFGIYSLIETCGSEVNDL